ncbi:MAG: FAD-binding oxidoreductase [Pseudomonas sp.]|uniref:FAD-binding oxidoreductase n=1 Tax=Pseudomonas abieticivorans TaxID=2931382 RepID=UPI0020C02FDE|nr:FAD-binding oxidoreductase [Pseudomonas sp. PIA16]MDE1164228.1 FAD-binding oxidoreductase [Pseudomonas sp.]
MDKLKSWGRVPNAPQVGHCPHWRTDINAASNEIVARHETTLAYGNGRSYGDSCLAASGNVLYMRGLDRVISFDSLSGRLKVEAGITLNEILQIIVPQGWFLTVTPGTQFVTIGGAIANDVHGKNHHVKGTFGRHTLRFGLMRSADELIICSPVENELLYNATIGGLGLTGIITWAEIQLTPIQSAQINTKTVRFNCLNEFFLLSNELDRQHEYSVAWIDCLAKGDQIGRGVFFVGDHAEYGDRTLDIAKKTNVPVTPPFSLINNLSLRAFNTLYWHKHPKALARGRTRYEPFFYPLDSLTNWNRIYGRKGFQQYQCVIPEAVAPAAMHEILKCISQSGEGSFLAVLKRCGDIVSPGLLSFPMPGISLALDFAQKGAVVNQLFPKLDHIVREAGGRLYPAKDAHMTASDFQAFFPNWEQLEALRAPHLNSLFWKRVTQ